MYTLGSIIVFVIAMLFSWERNKSVPWALLAGVLGWLYIIYYVITMDTSSFKNKKTTTVSNVEKDAQSDKIKIAD